ncbi:MAG: argininosuccinate synthase [Clostridiales Family XIII bacterium]|jgi:argininosuccinate synthase|nr:argininosuccinate synthase [Clostridiales Family XIII bacterium]
MSDKIVLAYSGGLDTSIILTWLKEKYSAEIIAVCCDAGQDDDFAAVEAKAYKTGASKSYVIDMREEFVTDYIWPTLKAGAIYENDYLLGTSMARPLMAKKLVEIAWKEGATYIAHGCTGKGNDQVRFESTIRALDPELKIIAPWRIWDFKSREDLIDYAAAHDIPIDQTKAKIYSRDQNLWHISHEGGNLEDTWAEHLDDLHVMSVPIEKAPDKPVFVEIDFEAGIPVAIDGEKLGPVELLEKLNKLGGENGVGTIDIVENRLVGMKSRGVYETPGGTILMKAHYALEKLIHDRETIAFKNLVAQKYAQMVYDGQWFTPLHEALDAFVDITSKNVTGTVRMELYKGNALPTATKSDYSLFNVEFATFGADEVYNQKDAEGFINLFSLPMKIRAIQESKQKQQVKNYETLDGKIYKRD